MIYILEDDDSIRKLVVYALERQGYEAQGFDRPSAFWQAMNKDLPSLIILDIMLPEEDGIHILRKLRVGKETCDLPIIMLTAKVSEYDRVEGLDAGADDYIVKPFGIMELLARVRAVLRRTGTQKETGEKDGEYRAGELTLRPKQHEVAVAGEKISLTNKEFDLLCILMENQGVVMNRTVLLDRVWDLGDERENRTLDVHIRTLRAKLGKVGTYIETVRGIGYRMRENNME